jgi:hypothetical protein
VPIPVYSVAAMINRSICLLHVPLLLLVFLLVLPHLRRYALTPLVPHVRLHEADSLGRDEWAEDEWATGTTDATPALVSNGRC